MKFYNCPHCAARVFFEDLLCLQCGTAIAYVPHENIMAMLDDQIKGAVIACGNRAELLCNWMAQRLLPLSGSPDGAPYQATDQSSDQLAVQPAEVPAQTPEAKAEVSATTVPVVSSTGLALCECCRYTRTFPAQTQPAARMAWLKLEQAKRYLFYSLLTLELPVPDRVQQPDKGLVFDFLMPLPDQKKVLTGHAAGVITINAMEADDAKREQRRVSLNESYRTVLGHLRHEIGHFYWDQLIADTAWLDELRSLFGDERADYSQALQWHYQNSSDGTWRDQFISYYASSHPWEDWAESWAHYLHIHDALDTAMHWGVAFTESSDPVRSISSSEAVTGSEFRERLLNTWLPLSQYLNAACRSLGEADAYPFVLPAPVLDKLCFIHEVIASLRTRASQPDLTGALD